MKNIIKTLAIAAIAVTLAGCAENNKTEFDVNEVISSVVEENTTSSTESKLEEKTAESSSTSVVESKPEEKPAESSITTTTTTTSTASEPEEKPVESKPVLSSSKPVESKPTHTHKFTAATCEKPATCECGATNGNALGHNYTSATCKKLATCTRCGATTGTYANHIYNDGFGTICSICGKKDPNYVPSHDCDKDGHILGNDYTETTTEEVEIKEIHYIVNNGYDLDLAARLLRETCDSFTPYLGSNAYGAGTSSVKTTGTKTITTHYHKCTVCGYTKAYNTEETVTPDDNNWTFANRPRSEFYPVIWYDVNNIPEIILEGREKEKVFEEEVWASLQ